jgi:hypothetical protein
MNATTAAKAEKRKILTEILYLGLTAPDDDKMRQCINLAELLAITMSPEDIEMCTAAAKIRAFGQIVRERAEGAEQ